MESVLLLSDEVLFKNLWEKWTHPRLYLNKQSLNSGNELRSHTDVSPGQFSTSSILSPTSLLLTLPGHHIDRLYPETSSMDGTRVSFRTG